MPNFKEIFSRYDTDKTRYYSHAYENSFRDIRNDVRLVFEIGVNRGGSVRAWTEYFPNALIVGLEIDPACFFEHDRVKIEIGDATNPDFIYALIREYGEPDIVIDDGSHYSSDIKKSYNLLDKHTKICYVIEDLGTQFQSFGNGFYINDGESATKIVHDRMDQLLRTDDNIFKKSIQIYYSIAFLFK